MRLIQLKNRTGLIQTCDKGNKVKTKGLMTREKPHDRGKNPRSTFQGRRSSIITIRDDAFTTADRTLQVKN